VSTATFRFDEIEKENNVYKDTSRIDQIEKKNNNVYKDTFRITQIEKKEQRVHSHIPD
jgi:predicted phage gp36 major capsid-like protein